MALFACAGNQEEESVLLKNDAIDDLIEVADLKAVEPLRYRRELHHKQITENYILIYDGKKPYLLAFRRVCRNLNEENAKPDRRNEARRLRAGLDTYRGCRIRDIYAITPGQAAELLNLGKSATR